MHGNWGYSILTNRPVWDDVMLKLPVSLELILFSMLIAIAIAVPAGVFSATKPYSIRDYGSMTSALLGISVPDFFIGIMLIYIFAQVLDWLPVSGYAPLSDGLLANLKYLVLPAVTLGVARAALLTRLVRASMLEVLRQDYVIAARAKGASEKRVILRHALMNAMIPTVTVIGLQIGFVIGGAIVVETLFSVPGLGQFGINAISGRDYPQVQAFIMVTATVFLLSNLLVDVLYAVLDPRISFQKAGN